MKNNVLLLLLIMAFSSYQCSDKTRVPNEIESYLIKRLQAEDVSISIIQASTTTDGMTSYEKYLQVVVDKPKKILETKYNERIYNNDCLTLCNFLIDSVKFDPQWKFDELRLKIIEKNKFLIFTDEVSDTKTYSVR
jgi:hypothetical protein